MSKKSQIFYYLSDENAILFLAFIGGFVDAAGYIKLHNLFIASITGNLVVACVSIYQTEGVFCRFLVSLFFCFGAGSMTTLNVRLKIVEEVHPRLSAMTMFGFEFFAFIACLIVGLIYTPEINDSSGLENNYVILLGCMMSYSMGVHNGAAKECIANCPATTAMTNTLVMLSQHASNTLHFW
jgi:uncharacterized membrane protein YoaK (UPF0700 family)